MTIKSTLPGLGASLAAVGYSLEDIPTLFAIFVGLLAGTLAAWPKEAANRKESGTSFGFWLAQRAAVWLAICVVMLGIADFADLSVRVVGMMATLASFIGYDALTKLSEKWLHTGEKP